MTRKKFISVLLIVAFSLIILLVYGLYIIPHWITYPLYHDIASDYIGAQALLDKTADLYPFLATAFAKIGIPWEANHLSTHPPTCYLLVVPLAKLEYPIAQVIWMAAMLILIILSFRVLNFSWGLSILLGLGSLLWPSGAWSLGQLTPIWLFGLTLAYKNRNRPAISGAGIALASLPKYFAAPALFFHFWRKKWASLVGFVAVWAFALGIILLLRPDAISAYISSNMGNSIEIILRQDNGAFLVALWRWLNWPGVIAGLALILYILWVGVRRDNFWGWGCLVWVGIALLPIAWVYSIFPLLPWLYVAIDRDETVPKLISAFVFLLPFIGSFPGYRSWSLTLSILISGILLILLVRNENIELSGLPE